MLYREAEKEAQRQQREAEKAVRQAEERQAKDERELLVAQKRQAQKDAQNTGAALPYSGTAVKTEYSTADNNWGNGKAAPTSSLDGRQWNTGENKAKKENNSVTTEKAVDSTADTAIRWKFLNSSNISKQNSDDNKADLYEDNDSFTPFTGKLKEIQDKYDNDFEFLWAKYGRRLMGVDDEPAQQTAKPKAVSKGPNREMGENKYVKIANKPDLTAGAQAYIGNQGRKVINYRNMVREPDNEYKTEDDYWYELASKRDGLGLKAAEINRIVSNPLPYITNINRLSKTKKMVESIRNKVYHYNENESEEANSKKSYTAYNVTIDGTHANSFQHIFWAAELTDMLGETEARKFLTAHETYSENAYRDGALYEQDDVGLGFFDSRNEINKAYPIRKQHAEMDLHNNNLGVSIAVSTPYEQDAILTELNSILDNGETIEYLRKSYPELSDRQILIMKKAVKAIDNGDAAVIWDLSKTSSHWITE